MKLERSDKKNTVIGILMFVGMLVWAFVGFMLDDTMHSRSLVEEAPTVEKSPVYIMPTTTAEELLNMVNAERAKNGVKPLIIDTRLVASSNDKAEELVREGWDSEPHVSDRGKRGYEYALDRMPECTYPSENLLVGHMDSDSGFKWWMNSDTHREAMLDPRYEYTGITVKDYYVVQHFCDID